MSCHLKKLSLFVVFGICLLLISVFGGLVFGLPQADLVRAQEGAVEEAEESPGESAGTTPEQPAERTLDTAFSLVADPAYQEIEIDDDTDVTEAVITYKNTSDKAQQIEFFAYDFKQNDHFGSIALLENFSGDYLYTLASFLSFEKNSLIVAPFSEEKLVVRITDKQTLSPGGHYAAVIARSVDDKPSDHQKILPAISSLLLIRKKGGERVHLSLKEIQWSPGFLETIIPKKINLSFENEGNVHITPRGTVKFKDIFGRVVAQGIINDSSLYILPTTLRRIPVTIQRSRWLFPIMIVNVEVDGNSNFGDSTFSSNLSFLFIDFKLISLVVVILILRFWINRRSKKLAAKKHLETEKNDRQKSS